jgi:hypothetical protein
MAQGGGLQVFAGYRTSITPLETYLAGSAGGGPTIGADARLLGEDLYFLIGGSYSIQGGEGEFFSTDIESGYSMTSARIGIGFRVFRISRKISIRSKVAGSIHFINDIETAENTSTGANYIPNDSFAGGLTGLGIDIGALTIDLDYEYGLINAINKVPESTVDFITLTAGFKF